MMNGDLPSDKHHEPAKGAHFGFPYCHQGDTPDTEINRRSCTEFTPPTVERGPRAAALGLRFYTGAQLPTEFRGNIFIAEHGSWSRSGQIGYRVARVVIESGKAVSQTQSVCQGLAARRVGVGASGRHRAHA